MKKLKLNRIEIEKNKIKKCPTVKLIGICKNSGQELKGKLLSINTNNTVTVLYNHPYTKTDIAKNYVVDFYICDGLPQGFHIDFLSDKKLSMFRLDVHSLNFIS